ncbi:hypothetical protein BDW59DRAFT_172168 [Aspergillus cavernicola]|uniref:Uncharacterized protein n=1 Tax=Aspergillus cavernicola TaxID=176166 RepID=A0ABR4IDI1_9EURO
MQNGKVVNNQNRNVKPFANGKISEMGIARIPGASNASAILTPWWKPAAQRRALNIAGRPILNTYGRIFHKSFIIQRDGLACFICHPICSSLQHYQPPCKLQDMSSDAWYGTSDTNHSRSHQKEESFAAPGQLDWDGDSEADPLPFGSATFLASDIHQPEFTCLLSTNGDYGAFIHWNGPSLLSPHTAAGDVFRYVSATLQQKVIDWLEIRFSVTLKYTGEAVTMNLRRCRAQIIDAMRRCTRSQCAAGFYFHLPEPLQTVTYPGAERALDPDWFIRNLSSYV